MKTLHYVLISLIGSSASFASTVSIQKAAFTSKTNVSAVQVKGETKKPFLATITLKGNELTALETTLAPQELKTGLDLRDQHMVERVFQRENKSVPPMVFKLAAPFILDGKENTMSGTLSIRGQTVNFTPRCTGSVSVGESSALKIICAGTVNLTQYGIEIPSHMGVKVQPNVELTLSSEGPIQP